MGISSCTENGEGQQEDHNLQRSHQYRQGGNQRTYAHLCSTVESSGKNVVVLDEPPGVASAQVPLGNVRDREVREDGRVDADTEPPDVVTIDPD